MTDSTTCKNADSIICAICNSYQHINCVTKQMPNLSQSALDNSTKVKPGYSFGCKRCFVSSSANPITSKMDAVKKQLSDLTNIIKDIISSQLTDIKADLTKSLSKSNQLEKETNKKIDNLLSENNYLRKQLNRPDIIVSGLPSNLHYDDLYSTAIAIGKACNVNLSESDINFCTWIRRKSGVLIKFNNVLKRDIIIRKYKASYNLKLNDVMETDIEKRIYLNNHLIPIESKLHYICRKKIKSAEIKNCRILSYNPLKIKLIKADKDEAIVFAADILEQEQGMETSTAKDVSNTSSI
ncbi:hypothetical protein FF38_14155 [Lucilia cuprina]|uniref:Uncharacterized protein n=1 Tax=Lucilia cuprina TaxID=7375 RepID=A0A0L0BT22_LUCCU|nr:hypothetical protein FF38_14155 [Lucilia cuprina]